jgi:hypothetical protein
MYAALTDPMIEAIGIAREARVLEAKRGGWSSEHPMTNVHATVDAPDGPIRLWVLLGGPDEVTAEIDGKAFVLPRRSDNVRYVDFDRSSGGAAQAKVEIRGVHGILGFWLVRRAP